MSYTPHPGAGNNKRPSEERELERYGRDNTAVFNWIAGLALWLKVNFGLAWVTYFYTHPQPERSSMNGMPFLINWCLVACLVGIIAPIKARHWVGWFLYLGVLAFLVYMAITVAEEF